MVTTDDDLLPCDCDPPGLATVARHAVLTVERAGKAAVAVLCLYEAAAIASGRLPMVSAVCRRHRWVEAALLGVLLAHLHHKLTPEA